jgi:hypothetical protein
MILLGKKKKEPCNQFMVLIPFPQIIVYSLDGSAPLHSHYIYRIFGYFLETAILELVLF